MTIFPLAAVLAVSTAWAGSPRWLTGIWAQVEESLATTQAPVTRRSEARTGAAATPLSPERPTVSEAEAEPEATDIQDIPVVSIDSLPHAAASIPASTSTLPDPSLLYAAAHRAHFIEHDPATALRAWDAYLLAAPTGPLAPEARYNRALTLVRLGRAADARRALAPFVDGTYRAHEARELLDALGDE